MLSDAEIIALGADSMKWHKSEPSVSGAAHWLDKHGKIMYLCTLPDGDIWDEYGHFWNPPGDLNDAWMLVEMAQHSLTPDEFDRFLTLALGEKESLLQHTASEAARAITMAFLQAAGKLEGMNEDNND